MLLVYVVYAVFYCVCLLSFLDLFSGCLIVWCYLIWFKIVFYDLLLDLPGWCVSLVMSVLLRLVLVV